MIVDVKRRFGEEAERRFVEGRKERREKKRLEQQRASHRILKPKPQTKTKKKAHKSIRATRPSVHGMLTRKATTAISRNAVMETPELLESILKNLDQSDLMTAAAISPYWNAVISTSPTIRNKIHFQNFTDSFLTLYDKTTVYAFNTLTRTLESFPSLTIAQIYTIPLPRPDAILRSYPSILNPLFFRRSATPNSMPSRADRCETMTFIAPPNLSTLLKRSGQTIHDQYLTLPPVTNIVSHITYRAKSDSPNTHTIRFEIRKHSGLRFRHVLETFRRKVPKTLEGVPASQYIWDINPRKSVIWFCGAIFASRVERETVEGRGAKMEAFFEAEEGIRGGKKSAEFEAWIRDEMIPRWALTKSG